MFQVFILRQYKFMFITQRVNVSTFTLSPFITERHEVMKFITFSVFLSDGINNQNRFTTAR